jgi:hypothetical protein
MASVCHPALVRADEVSPLFGGYTDYKKIRDQLLDLSQHVHLDPPAAPGRLLRHRRAGRIFRDPSTLADPVSVHPRPGYILKFGNRYVRFIANSAILRKRRPRSRRCETRWLIPKPQGRGGLLDLFTIEDGRHPRLQSLFGPCDYIIRSAQWTRPMPERYRRTSVHGWRAQLVDEASAIRIAQSSQKWCNILLKKKFLFFPINEKLVLFRVLAKKSSRSSSHFDLHL